MFDFHQEENLMLHNPVDGGPGIPVRLDGLSELWDHTLGDPEITIAMLDGPCDLTHPSLVRASLTQTDFVGSGTAEGLAGEHGTHTASVIFGQHESPLKGIAPQCRGLSIPIFHNAPQGGIASCSQPDLARAIRAAANAGAHVINVSGGQFTLTGIAHPMLTKAVQECHEQGRLIVAAAGNDGCSCLHVPGALPSVLTVGAMDWDGNPTEFSNWGSQYQNSGILAPGVKVLGALPGKRFGTRTGTSYAAPIVSGLVGLLLSFQKTRGLVPNVNEVRAALLKTALTCEHKEVPDCRRLLAGRINVRGAMTEIINLQQTHHHGGEKMPESATLPNQSEGNRSVHVAASALNEEAAPPEHSEDPQLIENRASSENKVMAAGVQPPSHQVSNFTTVTASECACQPNGQLVYVIGGLSVDFGTQARMDSFKQNVERFNFSRRELNVHDHGDLLRHLVGWREWKDDKGKKTHHQHPSHLYDARDLIWVLTRDESPLYALQPAGAFSEQGYFELVHFLMEISGYDDKHEPLAPGDDLVPFNEFNHKSLDTDDSLDKGPNPFRNYDNNGNVVPIVQRVAIPGTIGGMVRLLNGMEIPVIYPNQRGTRSWNVKTLMKTLLEGKDAPRLEQWMERILLRFMEEARNPGLTGQHRALNFAATQAFQFAFQLHKTHNLDFDPEVDSISVQPSPTCRKDSECYDVLVPYYDPNNLMRSRIVYRFTVDVSDQVPVLLGKVQHFRAK